MRLYLKNLGLCGIWIFSGIFGLQATTVPDLQKELGKITVIDIRSPRDFSEDHIPGAINIPAAVCPEKRLPPLGPVIIYGDGIGQDESAAAAALAKKPGLAVSILQGGFAAWKSSQAISTRGAGFKRESLNYISYARLKAMKRARIALVDLRKPRRHGEDALTDLNAEFPGAKQSRTAKDAISGGTSLAVLIDSGDGTAEDMARKLKAGGAHNYVILAGGEMILSRHGEAGLQRHGVSSPLSR
jgi:rhodanese-related sulfurtransferase